MSKTIIELSNTDRKKIVALYREFKKAEREFRNFIKEKTKDVLPGIYECEDGKINKFVQKRKLVNNEKLANEHPEVIELIEKYKELQEQTSVVVTPY